MSHKSCGTVGIKELLNRCTWREAAFRKEALSMKMGFVAFARLYLEMRTLDGACTLIEKEKKVIQISSKRKKETNAKKVYTHVHALNSRMHLRGPMCLSRGVKGIFFTTI